MLTTMITATTVSSRSACAVAITWSAAMKVTPGANTRMPTRNALSGVGLATILGDETLPRLRRVRRPRLA